MFFCLTNKREEFFMEIIFSRGCIQRKELITIKWSQSNSCYQMIPDFWGRGEVYVFMNNLQQEESLGFLLWPHKLGKRLATIIFLTCTIEKKAFLTFVT
jgi:hypothetical protein